MSFIPSNLATGIGSLPHKDPLKAVKIAWENFEEIPFWPQLPKRSFKENMCIQFSEGLPGLIIDEEKEKIYFNTSDSFISYLETFYEKALADDLEYFKISPDYSQGFYAFLDELKDRRPQFIKGQVTGPVTFGLTITDEDGKSSLYNQDLAEVITKILSLKARWQIKRLGEFSSSLIIFIDEPYLTSLGSAYLSLKKEEVKNSLNEVIEAIKQSGSISGIHCCGNTDWSFLTETKVDIISFDAYNFGETITLYPQHLKRFLQRGGCLAWGIVPASAKISEEDKESLIKKLKERMGSLESSGIEKKVLLSSSLITPSCGVGSLPEKLAEKIMTITREVSRIMRGQT